MRKGLIFLMLPVFLLADEGMWLVNQFPKEAVRKQHGFTVTDEFLARLERASVRFNNGGSGSFVSADGLMFTNHHVGRDCIQKVSTARNDYIANGFSAATRDDEKKCPDLEVNILVRIDTVTAAVKAGETASTPKAEAARVHRANIARIEKECVARTGNRCDVVTLYSGGRYDLYEYKKYTDVRLVFAPEESIAAFGGDPDNFTYPRYCLDFSFFRAYENGKPLNTRDHYFPWSKAGVKEGELIFVPGNPGATGRLDTLAALEFFRDVQYPMVLSRLGGMVKALLAFGGENPENKRVSGEDLLSAQNSFKAYTGFLSGLRDPQLMARKRDEEETLKATVLADAAKTREFGNVWNDVASAYAAYRPFYKPYVLTTPQFSELFSIARHVLRMPVEKQKPSNERLREYRDSALPSLEQEVFSEAPISPALEAAEIAEFLRFVEKELGGDDPLVKDLLVGRTPRQAADAYVQSSKLAAVAERRRLAADAAAGASSTDGMMVFVRKLDGRNRELRKRFEDQVEAVLTGSASRIALARYAAEGEKSYPDATFTFRIAFGPVAGYQKDGARIPYATDFRGLYNRATGQEPFALPPIWLKAKSKLKLATPFNFVSTADTHGGNSGSPTVNTKGEVVGILFDGNLEGLPNRFVYRDRTERSVHVAGQGILEALRKVYGASGLVQELAGEK